MENKKSKKLSRVATFRADPSSWLSENVGTLPDLEVARVLNAAGFYLRALDTNRWTQLWVRRLAALRNDQEVCAEIAAMKAVA